MVSISYYQVISISWCPFIELNWTTQIRWNEKRLNFSSAKATQIKIDFPKNTVQSICPYGHIAHLPTSSLLDIKMNNYEVD